MPATNEIATVHEDDEHLQDGEEDKGIPFRAAVLTIWGIDGAVPADYTELPVKLQYLAYGHEVAPTTKRPHLQAWAYAARAMRLTGWKKVFPTASIRKMRGTFAENDRYCSKASALTELGDKPMETGKKRTLHDLIEEVHEGVKRSKPLRRIIGDTEHKDTFVQYHNGIKALHNMLVTNHLEDIDIDVPPEVTYVYGPPGCGKSRYVRDQEPKNTLYFCPLAINGYAWKDGYSGQPAVCYENATPELINHNPTAFLMEIDRYFIENIPAKGSHVGWRPLRIYITTVYPLETFAALAKFSLPAEFTRRVTKVINLGPPLDFVPP